jgi:glycine cleavage system transcriptional repressor
VNTLVVAALGPDRPGIIAGITEVLLREHGNLEDSAMTILHDQFTMTMVVTTPASLAEVEQDLAPVAERLGLVVSVRDVGQYALSVEGLPHIVRVHGADRPGLVHDVTGLLARHDINITDLATRLVGGAAATYVMHVRCDVPPATDIEKVREELSSLATGLGIHATLQPAESDEL